jgi:ankyrin repeat protein
MENPHPGKEHNVRCLVEAVFSSLAEADSMLTAQPNLLTSKTEHVGETALHWLAIENHLDGAKYLLKRGAAVDQPDNSGATPLMNAARLGLVEMCKLLISAGANVNAADENKDTALHLAAQRGDIQVVQLLIASGADPTATNDLDETAVDIASKHFRDAVAAAIAGHREGAG